MTGSEYISKILFIYQKSQICDIFVREMKQREGDGFAMEEKLEKILSYFYHSTKIPVGYFDVTGCIRSYVPVVFLPDIAYCYLENSIDKNKGIGYAVHHEVFMGYVCFAEDQYILLGPVSERVVSFDQCADILKEMGVSLSRVKDLKYMLNKVPVMNRSRCLWTLQFLNYLLNDGNGLKARDVSGQEILKASEVSEPNEINCDAVTESHDTEEVERQIMTAILAGKDKELMKILTQLADAPLSAGRLAGDSLRATKDTLIASVSVVARLAAYAGMDYELALTLSDLYIRKAETMTTTEEVIVLIGSMMLDYCCRIRKLKQYECSSMLTIRVMDYISRHIKEAILLEDMARELEYSVSYMSTTFKKDTGIILKQYLQQEKIEEAKYMLCQPGAVIANVAEQLSFSSVSHFQSSFKKISGMTPMEYMKKVKNQQQK